MATTWTVQRGSNARFPFRVAIERDGRVLLAVRCKSPWPGPGQQIFCLSDDGEPEPDLELVESVPVVHLARLGRKLTVVLDRPMRKRCEFLFVRKAYKDGEGSYDQIFFRTESGIRAHRSGSRLELRGADALLTVAVDSGERYAWSFPDATVVKRRLAVGDYALLDEGRTIAVVERKSFDGLLTDIGSIQTLHHQLADLTRVTAAAVVIEAEYGDFLDARRLAGRWPATHVARVLAELAAMHPRLNMVFAGSRKLANQWTARFFAACAQRDRGQQLELPVAAGEVLETPVEALVRDAALERRESPLAMADLVARFPDVTSRRLRRVLGELEEEGLLRRSGLGRSTRWERNGR